MLSEQQYSIAPNHRLRANLGARAMGEAAPGKGSLTLQATAVELAFKKHQRARMGDERSSVNKVAVLRSQLLQQRARLGEAVAEGDRFCPRCGHPRARLDSETCDACGGIMMPLKLL